MSVFAEPPAGTPAPRPNDLLLAVADDFLADHPPDDGPALDPDDVYDWLVRKAAEVGE